MNSANSANSAVVSVVIPTRDRVAVLADALRSVCAQGVAGTEIVVVNDGGCDVAPALPEPPHGVELRVITLERPRGQATARTTGLAAASAPYVAFLDDDDVYLPGHLAGALALLHDTGADIAYSDRVLTDASPGAERLAYTYPFDADMLDVANYIPTSTVVCRNAREPWFRFDPELPLLVDWALWLRLVHDEGWKVVRRPEPGVAYHRVAQDASVTGRVASHLQALTRYEDAYRTVVARWPATPGGRVARFRAHLLDTLTLANGLLATGRPMQHFAYDRALDVMYAAFTGQVDEDEVQVRVEAAISAPVTAGAEADVLT